MRIDYNYGYRLSNNNMISPINYNFSFVKKFSTLIFPDLCHSSQIPFKMLKNISCNKDFSRSAEDREPYDINWQTSEQVATPSTQTEVGKAFTYRFVNRRVQSLEEFLTVIYHLLFLLIY